MNELWGGISFLCTFSVGFASPANVTVLMDEQPRNATGVLGERVADRTTPVC